MEWPETPDELRPVTIDDVIAPVPMNPSCTSLSCRLQNQAPTQILSGPQKGSERRLLRNSNLEIYGGANTMGFRLKSRVAAALQLVSPEAQAGVQVRSCSKPRSATRVS